MKVGQNGMSVEPRVTQGRGLLQIRILHLSEKPALHGTHRQLLTNFPHGK